MYGTSVFLVIDVITASCRLELCLMQEFNDTVVTNRLLNIYSELAPYITFTAKTPQASLIIEVLFVTCQQMRSSFQWLWQTDWKTERSFLLSGSAKSTNYPEVDLLLSSWGFLSDGNEASRLTCKTMPIVASLFLYFSFQQSHHPARSHPLPSWLVCYHIYRAIWDIEGNYLIINFWCHLRPNCRDLEKKTFGQDEQKKAKEGLCKVQWCIYFRFGAIKK